VAKAEDKGPAYNAQGVEHIYCKGAPKAEMDEVYKLADEMRGTNVDHHYRDSRVFNPAVSQRQAKAMYAAAEGHSTLGIPANVGKEFTAGFKGHKGSVKRLPAQKRSRRG
jgi:hypothetical protein